MGLLTLLLAFNLTIYKQSARNATLGKNTAFLSTLKLRSSHITWWKLQISLLRSVQKSEFYYHASRDFLLKLSHNNISQNPLILIFKHYDGAQEHCRLNAYSRNLKSALFLEVQKWSSMRIYLEMILIFKSNTHPFLVGQEFLRCFIQSKIDQ